MVHQSEKNEVQKSDAVGSGFAFLFLALLWFVLGLPVRVVPGEQQAGFVGESSIFRGGCSSGLPSTDVVFIIDGGGSVVMSRRRRFSVVGSLPLF